MSKAQQEKPATVTYVIAAEVTVPAGSTLDTFKKDCHKALHLMTDAADASSVKLIGAKVK